jgi:hypothetical protein
MLEVPSNQAAGLMALATQRCPRLVAVVSHGDEAAELPLLWRLCLTLVEMGDTVTVLDATISESETNRGLAQLLECAYLRVEETPDTPGWNVVPSAIGVQTLCASPGTLVKEMQLLGRIFPEDSVVILYCRAEWLACLLVNSAAKPLLTVSSAKNSLMTSYLALKRLVIQGKLNPVIVDLAQDHGCVAASLGDCARNFLGHEVNPIHMADSHSAPNSKGGMRLLAVRLLESAIPLLSDNPLAMEGLDYRPSTSPLIVNH